IIREEIRRSLSLPSVNFKTYKGKGCDHCHGTGFYGRTAIYEILPMHENIRAMLTSQPSVEMIKKAAIASGMQTLRQNGWYCVFSGLTTPSEVMYVATKDNFDTSPVAALS
ncbi:MAG: type II secretion system protein GspE, partial [Candidatus Omnitrophica bacterium]|nr:type II secretion system protein GspE [Candidatus Omnitrophota bacterium]